MATRAGRRSGSPFRPEIPRLVRAPRRARCYREGTSAIRPRGDLALRSSSFEGCSRKLRLDQPARRSRTCQVLSGARRQRACRRRAHQQGITAALCHPEPRPPGRARRARHPRRVADRLRQDARLRAAARRAHRLAQRLPGRARPRADARARAPGRRGHRAARRGEAAEGRDRLRRRADRPRRSTRRARPTSSWRLPAASST